jgi:S1-C subfamily serine protease
MHGRVVGIHSAISSSLAENFHVSITEFYDTWEQLVKGERLSTSSEKPRAYFGANVVDAGTGCKVSSVDPKSPAAKAGLRVGDLVLRVDQREIKAAASFRRWVAEAGPGESLSLEVKRGAKSFSVDVKLQPPKPGNQ